MMLERETFDAVLLDLLHPPIPAEEAVLKIKQIVPTLAHRLLVIGGSAMDPKTAELIEHHDLSPGGSGGSVGHRHLHRHLGLEGSSGAPHAGRATRGSGRAERLAGS